MAFDTSGLFAKGSVAEQMFVYGVLQNVIGSLLQPLFTGLQNDAYDNTPNVALSPSIAADLVNRGFLDQSSGEAIARKNGIPAAGFAQLIDAAKSAPSLGALIQGYQRDILGSSGTGGDPISLEAGLQELGIDDKWWGLIAQLAVNIPTSEEALNALLEGQISEDEARTRYKAAGGDMTWFTNDFNSRGSAPSPVELGEMVNRSIIPADGSGPDVVSFEQGFLEGPWRNKWLTPMLALSKYRPPPRTITALMHEGVVTDAQALAYFQGYGMDAETAAIYVKSGHVGATSTAKNLTVANIMDLYSSKIITEADATAKLVSLGYPADVADELLKLHDFNTSLTSTKSAVTKIKTLYTGRQVTAAGAKDALTKLGMTAADITSSLEIWDIELASTVKQLTAAQVASGFKYGALTQAQAQADLEVLGYTPFDAWVLLCIANTGTLPNQPARGAGGIALFE